jgi:hypothetical protein
VGRSRYGTVSVRDSWQALAGLSWLSFSRPPDLPDVPDPGQRIGPAGRPVGNSPRQPSRADSMSPGPSGGVYTRFIHHGPGDPPGAFPVAPIAWRPMPSDRTSGLPSAAGRLRPWRVSEVYSDEPPSNRTSTSRCIRLYGSAPWRVVSPAPFRRLVRPTPRAMPPISKTPVQLQAADDRDRLDRESEDGYGLRCRDSRRVALARRTSGRSVSVRPAVLEHVRRHGNVWIRRSRTTRPWTFRPAGGIQYDQSS